MRVVYITKDGLVSINEEQPDANVLAVRSLARPILELGGYGPESRIYYLQRYVYDQNGQVKYAIFQEG